MRVSSSLVHHAAAVDLVSPFPDSAWPQLWEWLNEHPEANFDDYAPSDCDAFVAMMRERSRVERSWGVLVDGELVGAIAFLPLTERVGQFHGICFTERAWGYAPRIAVRRVLDQLFAKGFEKVRAGFFASNERVERFLMGLGAVGEKLRSETITLQDTDSQAYLRAETLQHGKRIAVRWVALFSAEPAR